MPATIRWERIVSSAVLLRAPTWRFAMSGFRGFQRWRFPQFYVLAHDFFDACDTLMVVVAFRRHPEPPGSDGTSVNDFQSQPGGFHLLFQPEKISRWSSLAEHAASSCSTSTFIR